MKEHLKMKLEGLWECVPHEEIMEAIILSIDEEEQDEVIEQAIDYIDMCHNPNC